MENFLYTIRNAKRTKFVDIHFDLFRYSMEATVGDLLLTYDDLLGIVYYYLFSDLSKDPSWKNIRYKEALDILNKNWRRVYCNR